MSPVERLPCEVLASILRNLGNIRFLLPSLVACRLFYAAFKEFPGVEAEILVSQVTPDLVPCSIAVLEAAFLGPTDKSAMWELVDSLYLQHEPTKLVNQLRKLPVPLLVKMGHLHDAIDSFATEFAGTAWAHLAKQKDSRVPGQLSLSPKEYVRFCHAFYRVELYSVLALNSHNIASTDEAPQAVSGRKHEWLYARHLPWKNEQVACALDFLEHKFVNSQRQIWLSQGVGYIHKLANQSSYAAKNAVLASVLKFGPHWVWPLAALYRGLRVPSDEDAYDDETQLADYSHEDLATLLLALDKKADDEGPFEAWQMVFQHMPRYEWVMQDDRAGLRERAYVLWDQDRLKRYSMLQLFKSAPQKSEFQEFPKDMDGMKESLEERKRIWEEGGRGIGARAT